MANPNIWAPGEAVNADSSVRFQAFIATAGQTLFTIPNNAFQYTVGTSSLMVFVSGIAQRPGIDFTETSSTSFTLSTPVSAGTIVLAQAMVGVSSTVDLDYLSSALAASSGSGLLGYILDAIGAVATTQAQINDEVISVFRFMTAAQIADVKARTQLIDCRASIQAAMTYCLTYGKALHMPAGNYWIDSAGDTYGGNVYGLWLINGLAGPTQYKPFRMYGDGYWCTKIILTSTAHGIDRLLGLQFNGESCSISDIGISCPGGNSVEAALYVAGAGPNTVERMWCSGSANTYYLGGGSTKLSHCYSEFAGTRGVYVYECYNTEINGVDVLSSGTTGIEVINTAAGSGSVETKALSGIFISNSSFMDIASGGVGIVIDSEKAAYSNVALDNCLAGNNGFPIGAAPVASYTTDYAINIKKASNVSINNCHFILPKYGSIIQAVENVSITNCAFTKTGFQTSTNWACRDLAISGAGKVSIINSVFDSSAGNCIYSTSAKLLTIIGNNFFDVANGGLSALDARNNAASATVGDEAIYIKPAATTDVIKIIGNHFECPAAYSAGKYGITIDGAVAVPSTGYVTITSNTDYAGTSFATAFNLSSVTSAQKNTWFVINDGLAVSAPIKVPTVANANAPNSSLYFSSDATKLVWKDSGGVVNNLY